MGWAGPQPELEGGDEGGRWVGLADEDFKRLYHEVVRHLGRHKRRAYAVQLRPRELVVKYWEQKNVQVIGCDATEFLEAIEQRLT
jgi:hypothetical protein